ncbi:hypothetical protein BKA70DRAFT_1092013, partial [Coprinopsis sp. MPI-PUGE-AT-0042]
VRAHCGIIGNEEADRLAGEGALKPDEDQEIDLNVDPRARITGTRLVAASQSLLYRSIVEKQSTDREARRLTAKNLDRARYAAEERMGHTPSDEVIWGSMRANHLISNKTRNFLWKAMHNAYKLGDYWRRISFHPEWAECNVCGKVESMEHIMTECQRSGQDVVWREAEKTDVRERNGRMEETVLG